MRKVHTQVQVLHTIDVQVSLFHICHSFHFYSLLLLILLLLALAGAKVLSSTGQGLVGKMAFLRKAA